MILASQMFAHLSHRCRVQNCAIKYSRLKQPHGRPAYVLSLTGALIELINCWHFTANKKKGNGDVFEQLPTKHESSYLMS